MKREEVRELFPDATDEQVSSLLNRIGEDIGPLKDRAAAAEAERDRIGGELADAQTKLSEAVEKGMSDEERIAAREKAAEERERDYLLKSNGLDARSAFVSAGVFTDEEIDAFTEQVTDADPAATKSRADAIVAAVMRQREAVEAATRDALLKENPTLSGAQGSGMPTTVADFLKLPYEEQLRLKDENPSLLSQLKRN